MAVVAGADELGEHGVDVARAVAGEGEGRTGPPVGGDQLGSNERTVSIVSNIRREPFGSGTSTCGWSSASGGTSSPRVR